MRTYLMNARSCSQTTVTPKADDCLGLRGVMDVGSPLFYAIGFPELQYGQFAVCSMEISDGLVLAPDNLSHLDNEDGMNAWQVFDSLEDARRQAIRNVTAKPATECAIYNADGRQVHTLRNGQPVPLEVLLASQPKPAKVWWQVWK